MALNLTKTYTVKSNASADIRKAIKRGECAEGDYRVVTASVSGGFRIVCVDETPLTRWPEGAVPGRTREDAAAADAAAIIAPNAEAMNEALAADRDAAAEVEAELEEARRELLTDPQVQIGSAVVADWEAERAAVARDVTPGLARLRAHPDAEAIRAAELADQDQALYGARLAPDPSRLSPEAAEALSAKAASEPAQPASGAKAAVRRAVNRAIANGSPVIVEQPVAAARRRGRKPAEPKPAAASGGLSEGAALVLKALAKVAGDGAWIDQKAIPHGLAGRAAPGFLAGLVRHALIEVRADKGGKFSARLTAAGVALTQEAGR